METKKCWVCRQVKPVEKFNPYGRNGQRASRCNACEGERKPRTEQMEVYAEFNYRKCNGEIKKPSCCSICGRGDVKRLEAHHHSYKLHYALDVIYCCTSCHRKIHSGKIVPNPTPRQYLERIFLPIFGKVV